jgi:hypothetical protein
MTVFYLHVYGIGIVLLMKRFYRKHGSCRSPFCIALLIACLNVKNGFRGVFAQTAFYVQT